MAAGEDVLVIGAGGVGLNVIQEAGLAHTGRVIAVDNNPARLAPALRCGATHTIDNSSDGLVAHVMELTAGRGVEHAFEVVGQTTLIGSAIRHT